MLWPRLALPKALCLLGVLLLAGCVGNPPPSPSADFWIKGKIGVVYGDRAFSARFVWAQQGDRFDIDLWGPLGQGRTRLRGRGQQLEVLDGEGGVLAAGQPQALMLERLGWSLPLDLFLDWLNGRPSARAPVRDQRHDAQNRLTSFEQLDWRVNYDRFQAFPSGVLPRRVTAEKEGSRVNLIISERSNAL